MTLLRRFVPAVLVGVLFAAPVHASFHLMQIEQVIGGVNGDVTAQAVQLRMRSSLGEYVTSLGRLRAWDAAGANPVLIVDPTTDMTNGALGDRVLIVTSAFQTAVNPVQTPDFIMANPIPSSYLAAGSLTWESNSGVIYWRVSWGGATYTGAGTISSLNDANANCNPPFAGALPTTSLQALQFTGLNSAPSNTNAADYAVTADASVWTNNARNSETVVGVAGVGDPAPGEGVSLSAPAPNPSRGTMSFSVSLPRAARVRMAIYSVTGRLVRSLMDGELSAGPHDFDWDARDGAGSRVRSGAYYLRLDADGVRQTRTMMVIR